MPSGHTAAAILAGFVWVLVDNEVPGGDVAWLALVLTTAAGLLMVSNILYHSFKQIDFKGKVPFFAIVAVMLAFAVILAEPPMVLFGLFLAYTLSGPLLALKRLYKKRKGGQPLA